MDGPVLMEAIKADPADDVARLAYADWLDEWGGAVDQARARFIRLSMEDRVVRTIYGCKWMEPASIGDPNDAGTLLARWQEVWTPCDSLTHGKTWAWTWYRGFIDKVDCTLTSWMAWGAQVAKAHPLTYVRLSDRKPYMTTVRAAWYLHLGLETKPYTNKLAYDLPRDIWNALDLPTPGQGSYFKYAESEELANIALSQACITSTRKK